MWREKCINVDKQQRYWTNYHNKIDPGKANERLEKLKGKKVERI